MGQIALSDACYNSLRRRRRRHSKVEVGNAIASSGRRFCCHRFRVRFRYCRRRRRRRRSCLRGLASIVMQVRLPVPSFALAEGSECWLRSPDAFGLVGAVVEPFSFAKLRHRKTKTTESCVVFFSCELDDYYADDDDGSFARPPTSRATHSDSLGALLRLSAKT